jgi:pimeloyl-ACP methyl ester carboxylesterase
MNTSVQNQALLNRPRPTRSAEVLSDPPDQMTTGRQEPIELRRHAYVASGVQCPTLILHSRDDVRVPLSQAQELAGLIPKSRLTILNSSNHLLSATEPAWGEFLSHIYEFLTE